MINFSVIIPTCNRNDLLSECLDRMSPEAQLAGNFTYEVIVTDDGKKETNAEELIKKKYSWVKWTKGPQCGPAANRNNGASYSIGEWLVFLDDDCVPDLDLLAGYHNLATENNKVEVMEGLIYSDEKIKPYYVAPVNLTGGYLWACNFAVRNTVFKAVSGFDQNFRYACMEDVDLNRRLREGGYLMIFNKNAKVYHAPRPITTPEKIALHQESWIYYNAKNGVEIKLIPLLISICNIRLRYIIKSIGQLSPVKGIVLLIKELYYTIKFSKHWKIKYF